DHGALRICKAGARPVSQPPAPRDRAAAGDGALCASFRRAPNGFFLKRGYASITIRSTPDGTKIHRRGSSRKNNNRPMETTVADPVGLKRIGFALSGVVAIVIVVAALTVSASMGVL